MFWGFERTIDSATAADGVVSAVIRANRDSFEMDRGERGGPPSKRKTHVARRVKPADRIGSNRGRVDSEIVPLSKCTFRIVPPPEISVRVDLRRRSRFAVSRYELCEISTAQTNTTAYGRASDFGRGVCRRRQICITVRAYTYRGTSKRKSQHCPIIILFSHHIHYYYSNSFEII